MLIFQIVLKIMAIVVDIIVIAVEIMKNLHK